METNREQPSRIYPPRSTYALVFLVLVIVTIVEVYLSTISLSRSLLNSLFILLSLAKASLVAAFYMHLRQDKRLYTYIFVLPAVLLLTFAYLTYLS